MGLNSSLKTSVIPDEDIADLRNLVRDYYYFKDLQSAVVLKLNAELKVSFPAYLKVFSKSTTKSSLKLLRAYPPCQGYSCFFILPLDILSWTFTFNESIIS